MTVVGQFTNCATSEKILSYPGPGLTFSHMHNHHPHSLCGWFGALQVGNVQTTNHLIEQLDVHLNSKDHLLSTM